MARGLRICLFRNNLNFEFENFFSLKTYDLILKHCKNSVIFSTFHPELSCKLFEGRQNSLS